MNNMTQFKNKDNRSTKFFLLSNMSTPGASINCHSAPSEPISRVQFLNSIPSLCGGDLLVSSWDSTVRLYNSENGNLIENCKASEKPILSACSYNPVGSRINQENEGVKFIAGGLANDVVIGDFSRASDPVTVLGSHTAAVRCVDYVPELGLAFSGSWDSHVKAWDLRTNQETSCVSVSGKVFGLAVSHAANKLVVCDSKKTVTIYDLRNLEQPETIRDQNLPVLKFQLRAVDCFPDGTGYTVSSVEGRVAWEYFDPALGPTGSKKNYAFKCHREKSQNGVELISPVNALAFHPSLESFATGGGDGGISIWDGYNKKRLWKSPVVTDSSVTSLSFSPARPSLAIAMSEGKNELPRPHTTGQLSIRHLKLDDITPKLPKSSKTA